MSIAKKMAKRHGESTKKARKVQKLWDKSYKRTGYNPNKASQTHKK